MGQLLARRFHAGGHEVIILSREHTPAPWQVLAWDGRTAGPWIDALDGSDVCINLAGRSVNCRYTPDNRTEIYKSRIESTLLLNKVIGSLQQPPSVWLNASTATIYRHSLDQPMDESTGELGGDEPGAPEKWNFSVQVAKDWEAAFFSQPTPRTRKIATRSAITFNADPGSVFEVLSRLVRAGLGGTNGSGDQFVSWIHETDFVRAIEWLIATRTLRVLSISHPPTPFRIGTLCEHFEEPGLCRSGSPHLAG